MQKIDVVNFFGTQKAVADALGITEAAVSKWPPRVPRSSAFHIEVVTKGKLKVNPISYSTRGQVVNQG